MTGYLFHNIYCVSVTTISARDRMLSETKFMFSKGKVEAI